MDSDEPIVYARLETEAEAAATTAGSWKRCFGSYVPVALGKTCPSVKILALTHALGNLIRFVLRPSQRHDLQGVVLLGKDWPAGVAGRQSVRCRLAQAMLAGTELLGCGCTKVQLASPWAIDTEVYKWRHLIENFFCKRKEFKRIAMWSDKTGSSFAAVIRLASAVMTSR